MAQEKFKWGNRMIKIAIHLWTNDLPKGTDNKTAWASGTIHLVANKHRSIKPDQVLFNNIEEEFFPKLQEILDRNDVKMIKAPAKYDIVNLKNPKKKDKKD